jgi:predicted transcriptional regulator
MTETAIRLLRHPAVLSQRDMGKTDGSGGKYFGKLGRGHLDPPLSAPRAITEALCMSQYQVMRFA